jgi:hypothetical protein
MRAWRVLDREAVQPSERGRAGRSGICRLANPLAWACRKSGKLDSTSSQVPKQKLPKGYGGGWQLSLSTASAELFSHHADQVTQFLVHLFGAAHGGGDRFAQEFAIALAHSMDGDLDRAFAHPEPRHEG